ncbi:hypothetical protein C7B62_20315, partial [Pleurocapsa sp. CCALA 161]|uniref:aminotransferase class I/II-fold pyridoxal phosphate-dependent enzyme n=1 Tax=Pleurocapsa sp. CCALA 161 TaxID=2107688 RepID=UPI000D3F654C
SQNIAAAEYWVTHIRQPVRFADSINTLDQENCSIFLEIGPKPVLLGMGSQCLLESQKLWLPSLRSGVEDWQQMLQSLAQLYVEGIEVDWAGVYSYNCANKVALPTYPFQRERYWIENNKANYQTKALSQAKKIHPLLGQRLLLGRSQQTIFQSYFNAHSPAYMDQHRLYGTVVVPASSHVSWLLLAAQDIFQTSCCSLEQVFFPEALLLDDYDLKAVQLILDPQSNTEFSWEIVSTFYEKENNVSSWNSHATGQVKIIPTLNESLAEWESVEPEQIKARCSQNSSGSELYEKMWQAGYNLGSAFRWIGPIWTGDGEVLCQMQMPDLPDEVSEYELHPGLIDSCFQLLGVWGEYNKLDEMVDEDFIIIPFRIKSFKFFQRPDTGTLWCYGRSQNQQNDKQTNFVGDILLFNQAGEKIAEIIGFEGRKAPKEVLLRSLKPNLKDWFYEISWLPQPLEVNSPLKKDTAQGTWLLFVPTTEVGRQLTSVLEQQGQKCVLVLPSEEYRQLDEKRYQIDPLQTEGFIQLLQEIPEISGIVHLWNINDEKAEFLGKEKLQISQELGCATILHIVQALTQNSLDSPPPLWLVTNGTQSVINPQEVLHPESATLWGLGRVIALEYPEINCRRVDLDSVLNLDEISSLLIQELLSPSEEDQIAYRHQLRYVSRLVRQHQPSAANLPKNQKAEVSVSAFASYLITGGLGVLGMEVSRWLIEQGARNLVLTGRGAPSENSRKAISALEKAGVNILVIQGDISHQEDVSYILERIETSFPPIKGIIHAAGVLDDGILSHQSWEQFTKVMAPKVKGAMYLHQLTSHLSLDFFVCFSSMSSLLGSLGQSNYAAANAFMDALVYHRRGMGLPGLSINWGPWSQGGMAANLTIQHQNRMQTQGLTFITPDKGIQALEELLFSEATQVGVLPINWSEFLRQLPIQAKMPLLKSLSSFEQLLPQKSTLIQQLETTPVEKREELLMTHIRSETAIVLGLKEPQRIKLRQPLSELGIDSLMAVELKNRLESSLGISLSSTLLLDYPTLESLVNHLGQQSLGYNYNEAKRKEIAPEFYSFELYQPYQDIEKLLRDIEDLGISNPFFVPQESLANNKTIIDGKELINYCSFNYLGMSGDPIVSQAVKQAVDKYGSSVGASRILSGEIPLHQQLEKEISNFIGTEASIVLVSGHATNETTIGHLFGKQDLIVYDALSHNSIVQGSLLSGASLVSFPHNDWKAVDQILTARRHDYQRVLVAVEGVYSADGDVANLPQLIEIKKQHKVFLMIDEAHSIGVLGKTGGGIREHFGIKASDVDIWMGTLSKAFGSSGGYIAGSQALIKYLRYSAPGFVYATGISPANTAAALAAIKLLKAQPERVERLRENSRLFLSLAQKQGLNTGMSQDSAIVPIIIGDTLDVIKLSHNLSKRNLNIGFMGSPSVPQNAARLRFFITSEHTKENIYFTIETLVEEFSKLKIDSATA